MPHLAVTALTVTACVAVGLVMSLLGSVKLALARRPDQADSSVRNLLSLLNLLLIPMVGLCGVMVDRWGVRPMLIAGSLLLCLSFLALSAGLTYHRTLAAVAAAALGASALHVGTVVQLPMGLFGVSEVAASFQMGLVFVALGGLVGPPLLDVLLNALGFRRAMAALALAFLAPAFLAALPPAESFPQPPDLANLAQTLLDPRVLLAGVVFVAYAPLEGFVSVWTTTYLSNTGQSERQSRWLASFWGGLLASRMLFAMVLHVIDFRNEYMAPFLVVPAMLAAVTLGNLSGATKPDRALAGLVVLGLFLGPVYPMLLGLLFTGLGEGGPFGSAYGLLFTFGSLGSLALSPLVRLSASRSTIQSAMRIPLFIALALAAATLMFALLRPGD
jgi:hypothetical protein